MEYCRRLGGGANDRGLIKEPLGGRDDVRRRQAQDGSFLERGGDEIGFGEMAAFGSQPGKRCIDRLTEGASRLRALRMQ